MTETRRNKPAVIRTWIEMAQGYIYDEPPKRKDFEAILFINNCELRRSSKGEYLIRDTSCHFINADSKQEMEDKILAFMQREDVRLLVKGLESNDFDTLPRKEMNPPQNVIDGTADIYHVWEEDRPRDGERSER